MTVKLLDTVCRITVTLAWELTDPEGFSDRLLILKEKTGRAVIVLSMKYE